MLLSGETIEMYEYQKDFISFMAVLLPEAQTEIPVKSLTHQPDLLPSSLEECSEGAITPRFL